MRDFLLITAPTVLLTVVTMMTNILMAHEDHNFTVHVLCALGIKKDRYGKHVRIDDVAAQCHPNVVRRHNTTHHESW